MTTSVPSPADFDDLATVPPEEFVAARNALADRLKAEGHTGRAKEVKALRKPTVAQWIAAVVRHERADVVDELRMALRAVAAAQEAAIVKGDRDALRAATTRRREAVSALDDAVADTLRRSKRPLTYQEEVVQDIEAGVTAEVSPGTFGVRDDLKLPEPKKSDKPKRDVAAERRAAERERAIENAEARVARARDDLEAAEAALEAVQQKFAD
jgi:hypothetical protein